MNLPNTKNLLSLMIGFCLSPFSFAETSIMPISTTIQTPSMQPASGYACTALISNAERLACYDAIFRLSDTEKQTLIQEKQAERSFVALSTQQALSSLPESATFKERLAHNFDTLKKTELFREGDEFNPDISYLDRHWELSPNSKLGTWNIRTYQPVYALPVFMTSDTNPTPYSPNALNQVTANEARDLQPVESKFQLSLKTKAVENIFGDNGDLWLGYTQSSRWQVYNGDESRPFRETNYEPEAMLMFRTNYEILGFNARLMGVGFNHQSNGSSDPYSRSWNRIMFNVGLEKDNFALMIRPWIRLSEPNSTDDNNPDITDYIGRGDLTAYYQYKKHNFALMLRHSLKGGDDSHGAAQLDWTFPIHGKLRGHVQIFDGYGESLIDYNHRATYFGLGVSLEDAF